MRREFAHRKGGASEQKGGAKKEEGFFKNSARGRHTQNGAFQQPISRTLSHTRAMFTSTDIVDVNLKLIFVGDSGVGKTCFLRQFLEQRCAFSRLFAFCENSTKLTLTCRRESPSIQFLMIKGTL
jgi:hypothetical protein